MALTQVRVSENGLLVGEAVTDKVGLYGVTPVVQLASALQAAVSDGTTNGACSSAADLTALKTETELMGDALRAAIVLINRLRTDLIALGAIKGSA